MQKPKLLPPVPPFADRHAPPVMAWRQDNLEAAIEHLHQTKLETPSGSLLRLIALIATYALGAAGLVSPQFASQLLRLLLP